jgi:hypothetical protein
MSAMDVGAVLLLEICAVREAVLGPTLRSLRRESLSALGATTDKGRHRRWTVSQRMMWWTAPAPGIEVP